MLEIRDLVVRFGSFTAVDQLMLTVERGEIFGFLGPNGAGKTSTIKVLTGQLRPAAGSVLIGGQDLLDSFQLLKQSLGYVPDFDNHLEELTAEENLRLFAGLYRLPRGRIAEVLSMVELLEERRIRVKHFSKGMRKKLTIAREIMHRPQLLILDEPTANLDAHSKDNIRSILRSLEQAGATVFLTTHDMEEAERLCGRIAVINRGQVVEIDTPQAFKSRHSREIVDITYRKNGREQRSSLSLQTAAARQQLAAMIRSDELLTIHTREFNFRQVFLKLTGQEYH